MWPAPIRSRQFLWGLPGLAGTDKDKARLGNQQARWAAQLFSSLASLGVPCVIENPAGSPLWLLPPLQKLAHKYNTVTFDYCAYGTEYRKRTTLLCCHVSLEELSWSHCSGRGVCSFTGLPHTPLVGKDPSGVLRTALAAAYPERLCRHVCRAIAQNDSFRSSRF